ncbi:MAG: hypothetical protein AABZ61_13655 [Bacteroidota bacterium]
MGRKLYYRVDDKPTNRITDEEWENISRLQKWYNSEFIWSCGRLAFKMYTVFPNWEYLSIDSDSYWDAVRRRRKELRHVTSSENEITRVLEREKLVIVKKGGYFDGSLASGFTKVAGNEFNAYLVCEFILKASTIARGADFILRDEGGFIKCREVTVKGGCIRIRARDARSYARAEEFIRNRRVFSIVDPSKYDKFPKFKTTVAGFNELDEVDRRTIVKDWNWLGFHGTYDLNGDDLIGYNLNLKVVAFEFESS